MRTCGLCGWIIVAAEAGVIAGVSGCATRGGGARLPDQHNLTDVASRRLMNAEVAGVRPAADRVFREYFRIDAEASSPFVFVARPTETTEPAQAQRVRDVLRPSPNRRRQMAELHLIQDGSDVLLRCRVHIQRLDTAERAAFSRERGDDRPTDTPIDRRGASSVSTQEEWVDVGRDRTTEQAVLAAIARELAPTTQPEK